MKRRQENSLQGRQRGRERENRCERGWSRDQQLSQPVKCLTIFSEKDTLFSLWILNRSQSRFKTAVLEYRHASISSIEPPFPQLHCVKYYWSCSWNSWTNNCLRSQVSGQMHPLRLPTSPWGSSLSHKTKEKHINLKINSTYIQTIINFPFYAWNPLFYFCSTLQWTLKVEPKIKTIQIKKQREN